jgi:hypothetical protein
MANVQVEIQKLTFDVSDQQVTKVTVDIKHNDGGILFKNRYEKTFPARISVLDILQNHLHGKDSYLTW